MMQSRVIRPNRYEEPMTAAQPSSQAGATGPRKAEVSISVQTILLVAGVVASRGALASIVRQMELPDVLDSPRGEKGGASASRPARWRDGRHGVRAVGYAAAGSVSSGRSRSARSDSVRWAASSTVVSSGWSNTNVSR